MASKNSGAATLSTGMPGRLPNDAYAMIAVTMTDLYPKESWNNVFGQASLKHGVGVFSFVRYDPASGTSRLCRGTRPVVREGRP